MKKCAQCGTHYSDVTLSYCLQDGTPLVDAAQSDTPTVVLGDAETVVRGGQIRVPVGGESSSWGDSQVTRVAPPQQKQSGSNTAVVVAVTVVGMLILLGVIGVGALIFFTGRDQVAVTNTNTGPYVGSNSNLGSLDTPKPSPYAPPTPDRTAAVPTPARTIDPPPTPQSPRLASYPSTSRLRFARGAYSTSFSGDLNPGDNRSLVLACRSGQSLSANMTSGSSCVTIGGGGSSFRTTTRAGDNYLTLTNNCSSVVRFSISITII